MMSSTLLLVIIFSLIGGMFSALVAGLFLLLRPKLRQRVLPDMVAFAIGSLLAAAFVAIVPHAIEMPGGSAHAIGLAILGGILLFFTMEQVLLWRHSHTGHTEDHDHCHHHASATPALVLFGDAVHNLVDGLLIGATFLVDTHLGILAALAVAAHEVPHELGDFAVLLNAGMRERRVLWLNVLTSGTTVIGGVIGYLSLPSQWLPAALGLAAASFIYVAMADLIPSLQRDLPLPRMLRQLLMILLGALAIVLAHGAVH